LETSYKYSGSKLELLIGQALKLYVTDALFPLLEDPFAIVREKVAEELKIRGEDVPPVRHALVDFNPPRETDLTLDEDDLDAADTVLRVLVFQALNAWDMDDLYPLLEDEAVIVSWQALNELRIRGEVETYNRACSMCFDSRPEIREMAAQILSQLGPSDVPAPLRNQAVPLLLELLTKDPSPCVRSAAAFGFGHINAHDVARDALVAAARDPSPAVREGVAFALSEDDDPSAISTMIRLMDDIDEDVRDWATFGLGTLHEDDSPTIREALFKRITDPFEEARLEAYAGLAARRDKRILARLIEELETYPETTRFWHSALLMSGRLEAEPEPSVAEVLSELKKIPPA
jgi:HEAT repeats